MNLVVVFSRRPGSSISYDDLGSTMMVRARRAAGK